MEYNKKYINVDNSGFDFKDRKKLSKECRKNRDIAKKEIRSKIFYEDSEIEINGVKHMQFQVSYFDWKNKKIIKEINVVGKIDSDTYNCSFISISPDIVNKIENNLPILDEDIYYTFLESIKYGGVFTIGGLEDERRFFRDIENKGYFVWNYFGDNVWDNTDNFDNVSEEYGY